MKLTEEKYNQGMTSQEYISQIKVNKQPFLEIYQAVEVPEDVQAQFDSLKEPLRLAVFTADWCGDALSTTPAILRLAEGARRLSVRVFNRDEELELTNSFLPEERAGTVPVFSVYDFSMREMARFIETANALVPEIDAMDDMIAQEIAAESSENVQVLRRGKRTAFRVAHARQWGKVILKEFSRVVSDSLSLPVEERPAVGGTKWPPEN
jgi:hypothetical protein